MSIKDKTKIRVMVADDHPVFREGLCRFLEDEEDLEVVARPVDGEEAIRLARELRPDVVVMDVTMPKIDGVEAAKQIKAECPDIAILMVSAFGYEAYVSACLRAGAAGYMLKNAPIEELISAVRMVHLGEAVFNLKTVGKLLHNLAAEKGEKGKSIEKLHGRELEVLKQAARGKSNKDIAAELVISERTVQTHMVRIFRKLEVGSRTEAILRALKEGWITIEDLP